MLIVTLQKIKLSFRKYAYTFKGKKMLHFTLNICKNNYSHKQIK